MLFLLLQCKKVQFSGELCFYTTVSLFISRIKGQLSCFKGLPH